MWWISDSETGESEWRMTNEDWIEHCIELDEMEWCENRKNENSENSFENFEGDYFVVKGKRKYGDRPGRTADEIFNEKVTEEERNNKIKELEEQLNRGDIKKPIFNKRVKEIMKEEYDTSSMTAFISHDGIRA